MKVAVASLSVLAGLCRLSVADSNTPPAQAPDGDGSDVAVDADDGEVIEMHAQAPKRATDTTIELGRDELRALPGGETDALAAVRSLPGVGANTAVSAGRLVIRGGAPQDSLMTIDGVPVPFVYHAFDNTTVLPASMIGSITYSPGGFGVDDGRATSGRVAIATDDAPERHATVSLSMLDASANAATPLGHGLVLSGGVRRSTVDLLIPIAVPESVGIGFTTLPRYYDGQVRLDYTASAHDRVALLALTSFDQLGIVNHMDMTDLPPDFDQRSSFGRVIATWKHEDGRVKNRFVAALGTDTLHTIYDSVDFVNDSQRMAMVRDDLSIAASDHVRITAGALGQLAHDDLDARTVLIPTDGLPTGHFGDLPVFTFHTPISTGYAAAYAASEVAPTSTTTITAGARVETFSHIHATVFEPRIEIAQRVGSDVTLHASAGKYARDPSDVQALPTYLSPETADQYSLGADLALAPGLAFAGSVYHTERASLAVDDATVMPLPYASTGSGTTNGVDLLLKARGEHGFGWVGYSYGHTVRRDAPGEATHATAFDQTHTLTAAGGWRKGAWTLGGRVSLQSGLPYTDVTGATFDESVGRYVPTLGAAFGARYPAVLEVDVRVERAWQLSWGKIAAFLDVTNAFRDARIERYTYSADFSTRTPLEEYLPLPSLGMRGEF